MLEIKNKHFWAVYSILGFKSKIALNSGPEGSNIFLQKK